MSGDDAVVERASLSTLADTARPFDSAREPNVVHLRLAAGESVDSHTHPGRGVLFYVVDGTCAVTVAGKTHTLDTGDCLRFDGDSPVSPAATDDGPVTALVVLGLSE